MTDRVPDEAVKGVASALARILLARGDEFESVTVTPLGEDKRPQDELATTRRRYVERGPVPDEADAVDERKAA